MMRSEGGKLVGFVFVDTERPIADYVADAKQAVARDVELPAGTRLDWVGQFQVLRARQGARHFAQLVRDRSSYALSITRWVACSDALRSTTE